jgi:hypothetical protein
MSEQVFPVAGRVRVTSYSPYRGLKGTIQTVEPIPHLEGEELSCFYHIELDAAHIEEPIWFEHEEVELISS